MKYLSITGARTEQEVRAYLYTYAIPIVVDTTYQGRVWAVIEVPDENAQYQADRISSGMMGVRVHDTSFDAACSIIERL